LPLCPAVRDVQPMRRHNDSNQTNFALGLPVTLVLTMAASVESGIEIFDANDTLIGTACATAVGRRFE
jgi:hypothetical protein